MLRKLGVKESSIQMLEQKLRVFIKPRFIGVAILHFIGLLVCYLGINQLIFTATGGRTLANLTIGRIPNFWLLGPAGDMAIIGFNFMFGCVIYSLLAALIPNPNTTYCQRFKHIIYRISIITYGLMIIFILYAGRGTPGIDMRAIQLIPFRDIANLLTMIHHHQINLPFAYALLFGNIILFTPLAFLLRPHFKSALNCYWIMLAIFIFLEAMQFITNRGVFDIDDIIKYSLGVPLGFGIREIVEKIKLNKEEEACLE